MLISYTSGSIPYQFCDNIESMSKLDVRNNKILCVPKCLESKGNAVVSIDEDTKQC
jgi:hypothetical protein